MCTDRSVMTNKRLLEVEDDTKLVSNEIPCSYRKGS